MKKLHALFIIFVITVLSYSQVFACTSFAVYLQETVYGMNFDYPDVKIRYAISTIDGVKVFHMDFDIYGNLASTVAMNENGFFVSMEQLYPDAPIVEELLENQIDMHDFAAMSPFYNNSVEEIIEFISDKQVVNHYLTTHNLFADRTGNAMVLEVGDNENVISKINGKFIVMTNFAYSELKNKDYRDVYGVGSDRYATAYEYISEHIDAFDIDKGFDVLQNTIQEFGTYPTQSSMVFDPEKGEVYIAVKQDFSKIWKVNIEKGIIEGFKGFENPVKFEIDENGIFADELISVANEKNDKENDDGWNPLYNICFVLIAIINIIVIIRYRRHKKVS